ncbi:hypothetical protein B484DRAFT_184065 [Ochromonadaceae sp. CCMP2298]|nr:hypothetical protein B484DRAFT_184065 [Ochromonadaceae sp. CCMP2298]
MGSERCTTGCWAGGSVDVLGAAEGRADWVSMYFIRCSACASFSCLSASLLSLLSVSFSLLCSSLFAMEGPSLGSTFSLWPIQWLSCAIPAVSLALRSCLRVMGASEGATAGGEEGAGGGVGDFVGVGGLEST